MKRNFGSFFQSRCRQFCTFTQNVTNPANKYQIYISRSPNPYLNLSIEHYLLQKTPAESTVLFLFTNKPSIILGRNQNPWNEINLHLLRQSVLGVQLVRRRSGGGTVFHDEGNVNYSVICPTSKFHRDTYAKMVVRALKDLGADRVRVNNRHDIVLDTVDGTKESEISLKVSGSAYKLTRKRSLHHGTCLLCSPHLKLISKFLDSPAKPFIKTRGVDSVRSRITNLGFTNEDFQKAVIQQFCSMYSFIEPIAVGEDLEEILEIGRGTAELKSNEWIYGQTPQFTFTIEGASEYPSGTGKSLAQTLSLPNSFRLEFTARHGRITEVSPPFNYLLERDLHEITDWRLETSTSDLCDTFETQKIVGSVLNQLFR